MRFSVLLDDEIVKKLDEIAKEQNRSRNNLFDTIVKDFLYGSRITHNITVNNNNIDNEEFGRKIIEVLNDNKGTCR